MKLETFFGKFDRLIDTPGAVSKMRELIRHMAVQGKLVPQDRTDELAEDLLERLERDRSRLAIEQGVRLPKSVPPVTEDNYPHIVPQSWRWARIGSLGLLIDYGTSQKADSDSAKVPVYRMGNIVGGRLIDVNLKFVDEGIDDLPALYLKTNDILFNRTNSYELVGKSGIYTGPDDVATFASYLIRIRFHATLLFSPFFNVAMNAPYFRQSQIEPEVVQQCGQANFNGTKLASTIVPVPPLAEQKRIVAKVDELMALCDRLEAQQQERETRHDALARASLARFVAAPTPPNLQFLFHKSYAIAPSDLRKSILTLAVQGKLVPQNPEDEAAENGLARLCLKRAASPLNGDMGDGTLPVSWTRVRFEDIALIAGGVTLGRKLGEQKTVSLPYLRVANVKRGEVDLRVVKEVSIPEDEIARYALHDNDLLMTEGGDWDKVGRAAVWRGEIPICLHQNHVFRARMRSTEILPFWFERYFNSPDGRSYFELASKQTTNLASINMRQVRGCPVPFPPLAEQDRIVAKIDQLMALVDELETQLEASRGQAEKLMEAVVAELTAGDWTPSSPLVVSTTGRSANQAG